MPVHWLPGAALSNPPSAKSRVHSQNRVLVESANARFAHGLIQRALKILSRYSLVYVRFSVPRCALREQAASSMYHASAARADDRNHRPRGNRTNKATLSKILLLHTPGTTGFLCRFKEACVYCACPAILMRSKTVLLFCSAFL